MRRLLVFLTTLLGVTSAFGSVASAQLGRGNAAHNRRMYADPIIQKYIRGHAGRSWKDRGLMRKVRCGDVWDCPPSALAFTGKRDAQLRQYYQDGLHVYLWNGRPRFTLAFIQDSVRKYAAMGAILHGVPGLAALVAKTIDTKAKIRFLYKESSALPYWALFYLGAKKYVDTMIRGFSEAQDYDRHLQAGFKFLDTWKLSGSQKKKMEKICTHAAFRNTRSKNAMAPCIRWLGRTRTKNSLAKRYIKQFLSSSWSTVQTEAIRSAGHMQLKSGKGILRQLLAKTYKRRKVRVKVGRRYKRKTIDTWRTHFSAVPAAVALLGMGDRKAKKAIKYWLTIDSRGRPTNGMDQVFREAAFASPKAARTLKKMLRKTFKRMKKLMGRNSQLRRLYSEAALALLQMGDKTGLRAVLAALGSGKNKEIQQTLKGMGATPKRMIAGVRERSGIGHLRVGRGGLKATDALKIAKKIKSEFQMWRDRRVRAYAIRAYLDIMARVKAAKKKL